MALRLVGISGSLRRHSYNAGLLRAAQGAMPEGATLAIHSIAEVPLYNADVEAEGIPLAVQALSDGRRASIQHAGGAWQGWLRTVPLSVAPLFLNLNMQRDQRRLFFGKTAILLAVRWLIAGCSVAVIRQQPAWPQTIESKA